MSTPSVTPPSSPSDATPNPAYGSPTLIYFPIFDNDGDPVAAADIDSGLTSGALKLLISKDGASFANTTNSVGEVGNGIYYISLTASEMTADAVAIVARTVTANAKNTPIILYPAQDGDYKVDVVKWRGMQPNTLQSNRVDVYVGAMSSGAIQAIWDALTSALTTAGSVGKKLADWALGSDSRVLVSANAHTSGETVAAVSGNVNGNVVGSVGSVSGSVAGNLIGSVGSLGTVAKADVNAEMMDVLATDTYAEPSGVPAATSSLKEKIGWLFMLARNKRTQTSTTELVRNDADSATVGTSAKSDDGTTFTRGKYS